MPKNKLNQRELLSFDNLICLDNIRNIKANLETGVTLYKYFERLNIIKKDFTVTLRHTSQLQMTVWLVVNYLC